MVVMCSEMAQKIGMPNPITVKMTLKANHSYHFTTSVDVTINERVHAFDRYIGFGRFQNGRLILQLKSVYIPQTGSCYLYKDLLVILERCQFANACGSIANIRNRSTPRTRSSSSSLFPYFVFSLFSCSFLSFL